MLVSMKKNGLRLSLFALGCTAAIVFTQLKTEHVIADQQQGKLNQLLEKMLPSGSYDNALSQSCHVVSSPLLGDNKPHHVYLATQNNQVTGYIINTTAPDGYSGSIFLLAGITSQGIVHRIEVLDHRETPGLGDKIDRNKSNWLDSFSGHSANDTAWAVKKDGGQFDSFTGATITPRAVVKAAKGVLDLISNQPELIGQSPVCEVK